MGQFLEVDTSSLERFEKYMSVAPQEMEKAVRRARQRALKAGEVIAARTATQTYTTQQVNMRSHMRVNATAGTLVTKGPRIPLYKFKVSPKVPGTGTTLQAQVKKGQGGPLPIGFIARIGGRAGAFYRTTSRRTPTREYMAVSAAQMAGEPDVIRATEDRVLEIMERRVAHEMDRVFSRL